jgi:hypothetical protein
MTNFSADNISGARVVHLGEERGWNQPFMRGFENEANALAALDALLMEYSHVFSVHHEVEGRPLHHRANTEGSGKVIIDRILVPKTAADKRRVDLGADRN